MSNEFKQISINIRNEIWPQSLNGEYSFFQNNDKYALLKIF